MSFVHKSIRKVLFSFSSHSATIMLLQLLVCPASGAFHSILVGKLLLSRLTLKFISVCFIGNYGLYFDLFKILFASFSSINCCKVTSGFLSIYERTICQPTYIAIRGGHCFPMADVNGPSET